MRHQIFQTLATSDATTLTQEDPQDLQSAAIASLCAFVQNNFVGPTVHCADVLPNIPDARDALKSDGEELNVNVQSPELLYFCKVAFEQLNENAEAFAAKLWYLRFLVVYQRCLDDLTNSVYTKFDETVGQLEKAFEGVEDMKVKIQTNVEIFQGYLLFKRISKADRWRTALQTLTGVEITVEGVLGVRTKYQQKALPQLTLRANGLEGGGFASAKETHGQVALPTILKLEDDLRLERVKFTEENENKDAQLPAVVQQMVLSTV